MDKIIKVIGKARQLHFGTAFSNNSMKLSSNIPSKSMILGLIGASRGISMIESQSLNYDVSFKWLNREDIENQLIKKKRIVYKGSLKMVNILKSDNWETGNQLRTLDSVEYIFNKNDNLLFEIIIGNIKTDEERDNIINNLMYPEYPLYLGKSESLLKIVDIIKYELERKYDENIFTDLFIGESNSYIVKERLVEKMKDYRIPEKLESVYTLRRPIKGVSKNGYYDIEGATYSIW